jgi:two-component system, chemotaxis family, CheB/CheR fusion protein
MRILICDDNLDAAGTWSELLREEGHDARTACDGRECVKQALEWKPQAALIDIGLPQLDGYGVARVLRSLDLGHRLLLIAVSGYGSGDDVQKAREAGFDLHFTKPAAIDRILAVLQAHRGSH